MSLDSLSLSDGDFMENETETTSPRFGIIRRVPVPKCYIFRAQISVRFQYLGLKAIHYLGLGFRV